MGIMKKITAQMGEHEKWYNQASRVTTFTLHEFIRHLTKDYLHDDETMCHAMVAAGLAAMKAVAGSRRLTGEQAAFIMWTFIYKWMYPNNQAGMALLNYDNLLFPEFEKQFDKTIPKNCFEKLQEQAKDLLGEEGINEEMREHLQSIVDGIPPFGLKIAKE